jgi:hypothetical protein
MKITDLPKTRSFAKKDSFGGFGLLGNSTTAVRSARPLFHTRTFRKQNLFLPSARGSISANPGLDLPTSHADPTFPPNPGKPPQKTFAAKLRNSGQYGRRLDRL